MRLLCKCDFDLTSDLYTVRRWNSESFSFLSMEQKTHKEMTACQNRWLNPENADILHNLIRGLKKQDYSAVGIYLKKFCSPLKKIDLRGVYFINEDFSNLDLSSFDFSYSTFINCSFKNSCLNGGLFLNVCILNCDLTSADFSNALFIGCSLKQNDFSKSLLKKISFTSSYLGSCSFFETDFTSANFYDGIFEGNKFPHKQTPFNRLSNKKIPPKSCIISSILGKKSIYVNIEDVNIIRLLAIDFYLNVPKQASCLCCNEPFGLIHKSLGNKRLIEFDMKKVIISYKSSI